MKNTIMKKVTLIVLVVLPLFFLSGCLDEQPKSTSGVGKANSVVKTGADGLTAEQRNIKDRTELENKPGAIMHLYIIAPESGQVLIYSTVRAKASSSGKRLTPKESSANSFIVPGITNSAGNYVYTSEILQEDGTYGDSVPYIYWFDSRGNYHQHCFTGGQIIHISDQPIAVKSIVLNMELTNSKEKN